MRIKSRSTADVGAYCQQGCVRVVGIARVLGADSKLGLYCGCWRCPTHLMLTFLMTCKCNFSNLLDWKMAHTGHFCLWALLLGGSVVRALDSGPRGREFDSRRLRFRVTTQPSIPPGLVNRVPACMAGVKAGHAHLCRVAGNTV